uniref:TAFII55 protein conserved region domain-containing protein n=1 Tax=Noctiluca scintillans TaxID=2966 RepID=A0A7S1A9V6_NOCSC
MARSRASVRRDSSNDDFSGELYPFCTEGASKKNDDHMDDLTCPGEWPFDRQCVIRFPPDVAERVGQLIDEREGSSNTALELRLSPLAPKSGRPAGRSWNVRAFDEVLSGTLVDLPCFVESHIATPWLQDEDGGCPVAYKSADISQMLVVHRGPADVKCLDRTNYQWSSGLTPATRHIKARKFQRVQPEFEPANVREAIRAIRSRIKNEPYRYEEYSEVDEDIHAQLLRTQSENIWKPPPVRSLASVKAADQGRTHKKGKRKGSSATSAPSGAAGKQSSKVSDTSSARGKSSAAGGEPAAKRASVRVGAKR